MKTALRHFCLSLLLLCFSGAQPALAYVPASWTASGHASTITRSGIGISTRTDTANNLTPIFDAQKVTADVNAQVKLPGASASTTLSFNV